jgi:hypothetical protein
MRHRRAIMASGLRRKYPRQRHIAIAKIGTSMCEAGRPFGCDRTAQRWTRCRWRRDGMQCWLERPGIDPGPVGSGGTPGQQSIRINARRRWRKALSEDPERRVVARLRDSTVHDSALRIPSSSRKCGCDNKVLGFPASQWLSIFYKPKKGAWSKRRVRPARIDAASPLL